MYKKNKKGFTLAEVLITIAVIAVVAAILLPLVNRFRPDAIKIKYLKTYNAITEVVSKLARNQELFNGLYEGPAGNIYRIQKTPFLENSSVFTDNFAEGMNSIEDLVSNGDSNRATLNFTTKDSTAWFVDTYSGIDLNLGEAEFISYVQVWLDGNRNNNAENNHFQFYITADGQTHVGDEQGMEYLVRRGNLNWGNHNIPNPNNPSRIPDPDIICMINIKEENEEHYDSGSADDSTLDDSSASNGDSTVDNSSGSADDSTLDNNSSVVDDSTTDNNSARDDYQSANSDYENEYNDYQDYQDQYMDNRDDYYDDYGY